MEFLEWTPANFCRTSVPVVNLTMLCGSRSSGGSGKAAPWRRHASPCYPSTWGSSWFHLFTSPAQYQYERSQTYRLPSLNQHLKLPPCSTGILHQVWLILFLSTLLVYITPSLPLISPPPHLTPHHSLSLSHSLSLTPHFSLFLPPIFFSSLSFTFYHYHWTFVRLHLLYCICICMYCTVSVSACLCCCRIGICMGVVLHSAVCAACV